MKLDIIRNDFSVCKIADINQVDFSREFVFLSKTPDEISLTCETSHTPQNATESEPGWKALRVSGTLDFGLIGVVAKISNTLAGANISIFVISTYNTDYILIKEESFERAVRALTVNGFEIGQEQDM